MESLKSIIERNRIRKMNDDKHMKLQEILNRPARKVHFIKNDFSELLDGTFFDYSKYDFREYYAVLVRNKKDSEKRKQIELKIKEKKIEEETNSSLISMEDIEHDKMELTIFIQKMCYIMPPPTKKKNCNLVDIYKRIGTKENVNTLVKNYWDILSIFAANKIFFSDFKLENIGFTENFDVVFFDKEHKSAIPLTEFGDDAVRTGEEIYEYFGMKGGSPETFKSFEKFLEANGNKRTRGANKQKKT